MLHSLVNIITMFSVIFNAIVRANIVKKDDDLSNDFKKRKKV